MIRHHPADATLLGYAAGTLPPLHCRVVAVHLEQCPRCRRLARLGEEIGGAFLDTLAPAELTVGALERTLARLDAPAPEAAAPSLDQLIRRGRWWPVGVGIRIMPLVPRDPTGTRLDLIKVAPGIAMPEHGHSGPEITCVLHGAFADASGEYGPGDVAEGDVGLEHQPRALGRQACVCLAATTGRLRARSVIVRMLQPVFGI